MRAAERFHVFIVVIFLIVGRAGVLCGVVDGVFRHVRHDALFRGGNLTACLLIHAGVSVQQQR